jgi:hypothetical protein
VVYVFSCGVRFLLWCTFINVHHLNDTNEKCITEAENT